MDNIKKTPDRDNIYNRIIGYAVVIAFFALICGAAIYTCCSSGSRSRPAENCCCCDRENEPWEPPRVSVGDI